MVKLDNSSHLWSYKVTQTPFIFVRKCVTANLSSWLENICESVTECLWDFVKEFNSYQDVAYNTNTLAAWDMALLASFDTFTPSGSCWKQTVRRSYTHTHTQSGCTSSQRQRPDYFILHSNMKRTNTLTSTLVFIDVCMCIIHILCIICVLYMYTFLMSGSISSIVE